MSPRALTSSPRVLAAIPLAALAVVGSLTVSGQSGLATVPTAAIQRPPASNGASSSASKAGVNPGSPTAPQPPAPVAVLPVAQDAASAWNGNARPAVSVAASSSDIPAVALAAYQRAATTIDMAAPACHLDWTLLAGIGKVESNHGGGHLDAQGNAQPAIIGPALTGQGGTALVPDTDGGLYDGDTTYDHAVGPMQILPATWASVGVDANGDGKRDPQNIDDAALAAAVYLCSGGGDLSTPAGQHAAALRYNPAGWYADTVVTLAHAYATSAQVSSIVPAVFVPTRTAVPGDIVPLTPVRHRPHHQAAAAGHAAGTDHHGDAGHTGHTGTAVTGAASGTQGVPSTPPAAPSAPAAPPAPTTPPAPTPSAPTTPPAPTPSAPTTPSAPPSTDPTTPAPAPADPPKPALATDDQLQTMCSDAIAKAYPDATADAQKSATATCVEKLTGKTLDDAQAALPALVTGLVQTYPALQPAPAPSSSPSSDPSGAASPSATTPATDPNASPAS